jgi:hypothetical protein
MLEFHKQKLDFGVKAQSSDNNNNMAFKFAGLPRVAWGY